MTRLKTGVPFLAAKQQQSAPFHGWFVHNKKKEFCMYLQIYECVWNFVILTKTIQSFFSQSSIGVFHIHLMESLNSKSVSCKEKRSERTVDWAQKLQTKMNPLYQTRSKMLHGTKVYILVEKKIEKEVAWLGFKIKTFILEVESAKHYTMDPFWPRTPERS